MTLYHPGARLKTATGTQRVYLKPPGRLRVDRDADGEREVVLVVDGRVWTRRADGRTYEAPPRHAGAATPAHMPAFQRSAAERLAEWKALGIDVDVSHPVTLAGRRSVIVDRALPDALFDPAALARER